MIMDIMGLNTVLRFADLAAEKGTGMTVSFSYADHGEKNLYTGKGGVRRDCSYHERV